MAFAASESLLSFRRSQEFFQSGRMQGIMWVNLAASDTNSIAPNIQLDSASTGTHTFTAAEIAALHGSGTTMGRGTNGLARAVSLNIFSMNATDADIKVGTLKVDGTNILGASVSETFTITADTENSQQGAVAFATLTSFSYTAMDDDSVAVSIGVGNKIGLWNTLPTDTMIFAGNGTSADASAAITPDDDEIEKCVIDFDTDPTGTSDHSVLYWIPPFAAATAVTGY